jgi:hypothetical protein
VVVVCGDVVVVVCDGDGAFSSSSAVAFICLGCVSISNRRRCPNLLMVFIFSRYVFVWPYFDEEEWWYVFEVVVAATMMVFVVVFQFAWVYVGLS